MNATNLDIPDLSQEERDLCLARKLAIREKERHIRQQNSLRQANETMVCEICMDHLHITDHNFDAFPLDCGHLIHEECLIRYTSAELEKGRVPIHCPMACPHEIDSYLPELL
mmetsp:Transcript_699/g.865  ORF Transcript_699/g.865 Transcript_699/m.865 type:complete len:112 (+) Transcript_699:1853-2188(+)